MIRKIIRIDEEKCNGCGACAAACHVGVGRKLQSAKQPTNKRRVRHK